MHRSDYRLIDIKTYRKLSWIFAWNYRSSFHWAWMEFDEIRHYMPWDEVRHIDWLSSAKSDKVFIKKYKEDKSSSTYFLLDTSETMFFWTSWKNKLDSLKDFYTILWLSSERNWDIIATSYISNNTITDIQKSRAKGNTFRILDEIESLVTRSKWPKTLSEFFKKLYDNRVSNSIIFVISDILDIWDESMIRALSKRNDLVYIHISDSFEKSLTWTWLADISNINLKIALNWEKSVSEYQRQWIEKENAFKKALFALWASYICADENDNPYTKLYNFFSYRQRK